MKKKLKFILSLLLILAISVCSFITPASSFENDVVTSSYSILMINMDTNTPVYSRRPDEPWLASYLSEIMTFIIMTEKVEDPAAVSVTVNKSFINKLSHTDGCLARFVGETLTLKDLATIMMLTSGSDAAYLIAHTVSSGNIKAFVEEMNAGAAALGCTQTTFMTPGYHATKQQSTTCSDLAILYSRLVKSDLYQEIMQNPTFTPDQYGDGDKTHTVTTENSILNPKSPYYFRYATDGKYAYDRFSGASLVVSTSYKDSRYLFIALRGKNDSEQNVFADARLLTTWAYLNLSDRKVIDTDTTISSAKAVASWGEYDISLYADNSARKTLPNEYDKDKLSIELNTPAKLNLPLFKGESVGSASIGYDNEVLDEVSIVPNHDEGASMLNDLGRFSGYALAKLFPNTIKTTDRDAAAATEEPTKSAAATAPKKTVTKPAATAATEAATER